MRVNFKLIKEKDMGILGNRMERKEEVLGLYMGWVKKEKNAKVKIRK
jgi:hypothetical protein